MRLNFQGCDSIAVELFCCSDLRLCKRGLVEHHNSEDIAEHGNEADSVQSDDQDDVCECGSSDPADTMDCEQLKKTDDVIFDGEFAQDIELMKSMGLPLSFTQSSELHRKKVWV